MCCIWQLLQCQLLRSHLRQLQNLHQCHRLMLQLTHRLHLRQHHLHFHLSLLLLVAQLQLLSSRYNSQTSSVQFYVQVQMCGGMSFLNSVWNVFWRLCICNGTLPKQCLINFLYILQCRVLNQEFCRTRWQHKDQLWRWASLWPSFCKNLVESASSSTSTYSTILCSVLYGKFRFIFFACTEPRIRQWNLCGTRSSQFLFVYHNSWIILGNLLHRPACLPASAHVVTQLKRGLICWFHFMLLQLGSL